MRKVKWKNVFRLIALLVCAAIVLHDFYMISFSQFFTGELIGWTWFGIATFFPALIYAVVETTNIYEEMFGEPLFKNNLF